MIPLYQQFIEAGASLPREVFLVELLWKKEPAPREGRALSKRTVFEVYVASELGQLTGKMLRVKQGSKPTQAGSLPEDSQPIGSISGEEIQEFVRAVGDRNPLHEGDYPIVPGCMLLDLVKHQLPSATSIELRLKAPVYAGEDVYMVPLGTSDYQLLTAAGVAVSIVRVSQ